MKNSQTLRILSLWSSIVLICIINTGTIKANQDYDPGDTIDVVHYNIHINYVDYGTHEIQGFAEVILTPKFDDINVITLELMDLTVDSITSSDVNISAFSHQDPYLYVNLQEAFNTTDTVAIKVYYQGVPFHEGWGGFHFSGDYAFNLGVGFVSIPHNLGKSWFPCIDNFTDRATYDCYVTVGEGQTAVCGGTLIQKTNNSDNSATFHWNLPQAIPTYLASVATGQYALTEDTYTGLEGEVQITIYTKPSDTGNVAGSFIHLKDITNIFETYFGPYKWDRIGYVGTSIGAMEHATNIAYPHSSINGNLSSEYLLAHELFHMWFGDLVTCDKAEEMWINEGWATYCGMFYKEHLYSVEDFKEDLLDRHADVLQFCHTPSGDGSYFPLNEIPQEITYGMTAYDRGSTVVQSLRDYLGDSLFFSGVKSFLEEYAFVSVSSYELRDALTDATGVDMNGFFDNWVFNSGTPHYSIDSFGVMNKGRNYEVNIYPRQKRKGGDFMGNYNIIHVTFMDEQWNMITDTVKFSGKSGCSVKDLSIEPVAAFVDLDQNSCDATTDGYEVINIPGEYSFPNTFFTLDVDEFTDSAFFRIVHNWVPPDSMVNPHPGLTLSDYRYWKVEGIFPEIFDATGKFFYSRASYLDNNLITNQDDSLVMLYRPGPGYEWQSVNFTQVGIWMIGNLYVDDLQPGEYTLAIWDSLYVGEKELNKTDEDLRVYPNPSSTVFNIEWDTENAALFEVFNMDGKIVDTIMVNKNQKQVQWDPAKNQKGIYYLILYNNEKSVIGHQKLIYR